MCDNYLGKLFGGRIDVGEFVIELCGRIVWGRLGNMWGVQGICGGRTSVGELCQEVKCGELFGGNYEGSSENTLILIEFYD